jgi:enterobactin synthetase component F
MDADAFSRLAAGAPQCQRADLALALTALWLGRLCNRLDYAAGFIFMRRMGSAALTATGPVLNVLPLAVHIDAGETLAELALRLAGQLKKMRRHQRYDAEQIVRDSGKAAGDEPLFGPVLNVKVFDYQLDIDGVEAMTHTWPPARSTILSWRCSRMRPAGCRWRSSPTSSVTMKRRCVATWRD